MLCYTVLFCSIQLSTASTLLPHSFIHCEQGVAASMMATLMPVTVFAEGAMEALTVKLLLEKVSSSRIVPLMQVHLYLCVYKCMACVH